MSDDLVINLVSPDHHFLPLIKILRLFGGYVSDLSDDHIYAHYKDQHEKGYRFYAVYRDGNPIGVYGLRVVMDPLDAAPCAILNNLIVDVECRGQGVGRLLLYHGLQNVRNLGVKMLILNVDLDNDRAIGFYERAGFRRVATMMLAQL